MTDDELEQRLRAHYRAIDPGVAPSWLGVRIGDALERRTSRPVFIARTRPALAAVLAVVVIVAVGLGLGLRPGGFLASPGASPTPTASPQASSPSPTASPSPEFGPATWALDPAFPSPGPSSTELHVLVWEQACSSGTPTTGRMSAPIVEYGSTTVTITISVRPLEGVRTCPLPRGTPDLVELSEPLGSRTLLDGGRVPVAPPSPAF